MPRWHFRERIRSAPGAIAVGVVVALIVALLLAAHFSPAGGGGNATDPGTGPSSSATPIFTAPAGSAGAATGADDRAGHDFRGVQPDPVPRSDHDVLLTGAGPVAPPTSPTAAGSRLLARRGLQRVGRVDVVPHHPRGREPRPVGGQ